MTQNTGSNFGHHVCWAELLPSQFRSRQKQCPIVYVPLGLCEPHGQITAYGLDTLKAEYICIKAARRWGGIVAPTLGYHIHESGFHAKWLEDEIGENNPCMTSMPPYVWLHFIAYQIRAFMNAGFKGIVFLSGHAGGSERDLRMLCDLFMTRFPIQIWAGTDAELAAGRFDGDHAGKFELSQLMYIRPDLVDWSKLTLQDRPGEGGRLALGFDAEEASFKMGEDILSEILQTLKGTVAQLNEEIRKLPQISRISYDEVESLWADMLKNTNQWLSLTKKPGQGQVTPASQWKKYEKIIW